MSAKQPVETTFKQINTSLPGDLVAFLERQAALSDRTISGQIRHYIAQAARTEAAAPPKPFGVVLPTVESSTESIAEARSLIAEWNAERARIQRRQRSNDASAADDMRDEVLRGQVELVEQRIAVALRHMPSNGGRKHG